MTLPVCNFHKTIVQLYTNFALFLHCCHSNLFFFVFFLIPRQAPKTVPVTILLAHSVPKWAILKFLQERLQYVINCADSYLFDLFWQWHEESGSSPNDIHDFLERFLLQCSQDGNTALLKHVVEITRKYPPVSPLRYENCIVTAAFSTSREKISVPFLSFMLDDLGLKVSEQTFNQFLHHRPAIVNYILNKFLHLATEESVLVAAGVRDQASCELGRFCRLTNPSIQMTESVCAEKDMLAQLVVQRQTILEILEEQTGCKPNPPRETLYGRPEPWTPLGFKTAYEYLGLPFPEQYQQRSDGKYKYCVIS